MYDSSLNLGQNAKSPRISSVTPRAVILGAILVIANSYWISFIEMVWHTLHFTVMSLPMNVIFTLLMLAWVNTLIKWIAPSSAFSQQELIVIYAMLAVTSAFSGHDCMPRLMGMMAYAFKYATPENDWKALFHSYLPRWLLVDEERAVRDFYEGGMNFFTGGYIRFWLSPILNWSVIVFSLLFIFLCINVIIRKQWAESERLSYPIIQIPLEVTSWSGKLFRDRIMWIGFAVAGGIDLINGLRVFFPVIPEIPIRKYEIGAYFTQKPWNAIGYTPITFYPFLIGLSFLLPLDLSFSCWFFYLIGKVQRVFGSMVGLTSVRGYPFFGEQGTGAVIALFFIALWSSRLHLKKVMVSLFHRDKYDVNEPLRYRTAVILGTLSMILFLAFSMRAGMSPWAFVMFIGLYLAISIVLTRMRAELGPPIHAINLVTPQDIMITTIGTRNLRANNLTMLALFRWFNGGNRSHAMPHQLEAFKAAERTRIKPKLMFLAIVIACIVGIQANLWLYPYAIYRDGVLGASEQLIAGGWDAYGNLSSWLSYPQLPDVLKMLVMGVSFIFSVGIMIMRSRFVWWPLHPVGYVIGVSSGSIDKYWFALVLCTAIKWAMLRHGGVKSYRKAVPFFMGLVLGETIISCFWAAISLMFRVAVYDWW